jgi:hypothetical protein
VNQFLESRRNRIAREALDVANAKKFESLVMKQILIETGKSQLVTRGIFRSRDGKDIEGDSLVALREIFSRNLANARATCHEGTRRQRFLGSHAAS